MGATGGFPVELILFGMIAAFLVLRLRSILGKRQGFERPAEPPRAPGDNVIRPAKLAERRPIEGRVVDVAAEPAVARTLPDPTSPAGETLARMTSIERGFDPRRFLDGAEAAFRIVVAAFAAGNRDELRPLLSDDTYRAFDGAIAGRDTAGETQRTEIKAINAATIEATELRGVVASITVRFVSDQISVTNDRNGVPVVGTDAVMEMVDLWTFERQLGSTDLTWRLVAARSA